MDETSTDTKAKVMIFGTFHFSNPGLDKVKNRVTDISSQDSQNYLTELAKRISSFNPTNVLLEYNPSNDKDIMQCVF